MERREMAEEEEERRVERNHVQRGERLIERNLINSSPIRSLEEHARRLEPGEDLEASGLEWDEQDGLGRGESREMW